MRRAPEVLANIAICLIHQANYLLDQHRRRLEKDFVQKDGIREQMTKARLDYRKQQQSLPTRPPDRPTARPPDRPTARPPDRPTARPPDRPTARPPDRLMPPPLPRKRPGNEKEAHLQTAGRTLHNLEGPV